MKALAVSVTCLSLTVACGKMIDVGAIERCTSVSQVTKTVYDNSLTDRSTKAGAAQVDRNYAAAEARLRELGNKDSRPSFKAAVALLARSVENLRPVASSVDAYSAHTAALQAAVTAVDIACS